MSKRIFSSSLVILAFLVACDDKPGDSGEESFVGGSPGAGLNSTGGSVASGDGDGDGDGLGAEQGVGGVGSESGNTGGDDGASGGMKLSGGASSGSAGGSGGLGGDTSKGDAGGGSGGLTDSGGNTAAGGDAAEGTGGSGGGAGDGGSGSSLPQECVWAEDCSVFGDCCACEAQVIGADPPESACGGGCFAGACEFFDDLEALCIDGQCVLSVVCEKPAGLCEDEVSTCDEGYVTTYQDSCFGTCVKETECP